MEAFSLISDLVLAWAAALLGGAIAKRLRQPVVLGYLLAGMLISPYTPGPVGNVGRVRLFAEIGVVFLMFALGVELSLEQLKRAWRVSLVGGLLQILLTTGLGVSVWVLLGRDVVEGIFFGAIIAISSTTVAIKVLLDRGELDSPHGVLALGISMVQDLSLVPLMVILPALVAPKATFLPTILVAFAKAVVLLVGAYLLGTRLVPWILAWVAKTASRELFLLTIVTIALGTALGSAKLGLSVALGAFLAGLVVSESVYSHQILAEVLPLRDIFASLFFVSVGMLVAPKFLLENALAVLIAVAAIVLGKFAICAMIPLLFRYPTKTAIYTGLALAQIGEFSFILARMGVDRGLVSEYLYAVTLSGALVAILLNPLVLHVGPVLVRGFQRIPLFRERAAFLPTGESLKLEGHVVICGLGRVGRELALALNDHGIPYLVIDYDPLTIEEVRRQGLPCIYGDAANPAILGQARLQKARVLAVAIPDFAAAELCIRHARRLSPRLDVIVRTHSPGRIERLRDAGAVEVVYPEIEAGLEFVRHTLQRFKVKGPAVEQFVSKRRASYHPQEPAS